MKHIYNLKSQCPTKFGYLKSNYVACINFEDSLNSITILNLSCRKKPAKQQDKGTVITGIWKLKSR